MVRLLVLALLATGCKSLVYQCASDGECGTGARCEPTQFCSFADSSCASGFRYGEHAGNSLGNECVGTTMIDAPMQMADARPDTPAGTVTKTFGETSTAMHKNVTIDNEMTVGVTTPVIGVDHNSVDTGEKGMWRFDITAIPTNATVLEARLELETTGDGNIFTAGDAQVFRLLESWEEDTVTYFNRNATTAWATVGAGSPNSRDPLPIAVFSPTIDMRYTVTLPNSVVQGWVSMPTTNFGVLVDASNSMGHLHLATKEHAVPDKRALLVVVYRP
jgi:hypothetical protein